jgi:lipoprotein-anchoring transpeptidase ErfK/SrfK
MEAVQIQLTGDLASVYDIYYRVHVQNIGWMGWAKNGASAGTSGYSYRIEAIQIKLQRKGTAAPGSTANAFKEQTKEAWQIRMDQEAASISSPTAYKILVDKKTNHLGIYQNKNGTWTPIYYWLCSTGAGYCTPSGTFSVGSRGYSFGGSTYTCYYWTAFIGSSYLFHSTLYHKGTFNSLDGRLGMNISHGCVRLAISNAKWIYQNIPSGTTVRVYMS